MTIDALTGVLVIPAIAAALLAVLPGYRITARINVVATGLTLLCALSLFFRRRIRHLSAGRRSQRHLHRADHLRRLHDQHFQRELYRP